MQSTGGVQGVRDMGASVTGLPKKDSTLPRGRLAVRFFFYRWVSNVGICNEPDAGLASPATIRVHNEPCGQLLCSLTATRYTAEIRSH